MQDLTKQQRLPVIDIAKGIGIFLVIYCHVNFHPDILTVVYGVHMPLFFIISGILFDSKKYTTFKSFVKRRIKTLIIPYVLTYVFCLLCSFILCTIQSGISMDIIKNHAHQLLNMILDPSGSGGMVYPPFWFVLSLFGTEIIYYFLSKIRYNWVIAIICTAFSLTGWFLQSTLIEFPNRFALWNYDSIFFVMGFYAFGNLLRMPAIHVMSTIQQHKNKVWICIAIILVGLVIYFPIVFWNGKVSIGSKELGNGFLFYITGIVGTIVIMAISMICETSKALSFFGKNSFALMAFHYIPIHFMNVVLEKLNISYHKDSVLETIIPVIFVIAMTLLLTWGYNSIMKKCTRKAVLSKNSVLFL